MNKYGQFIDAKDIELKFSILELAEQEALLLDLEPTQEDIEELSKYIEILR
jgi:hypothetical protein